MTKLLRACLLVVLVACSAATLGQPLQESWVPGPTTVVSDVWHPWYEIKSDPENPNSLLICGTKWDTKINTLLGFVYSSSDGGKTWQTALEDRRSPWVSEHSCAFGPKHRAYFVSEASHVIDGEAHHELGTTRLYVSTDSGQHWTQGLDTGWADFSTSAVSRTSGRLFTFFHDASTLDPVRESGSNVGLLIFPADGKAVNGPILSRAIQDLNYRGAYPSDAVALKSGAVVALYQAMNVSQTEGYLALIHADDSPTPTLETRVISRTILGKSCDSIDRGSMAYDPDRDRLFVVYGDGCEKGPIMLASSEDEGRTWTKGVPIANIEKPEREIECPSLVVGQSGTLGLLWEEGWFSGKWLFSTIRDGKLTEPPTELSHGQSKLEIGHDSIWLQIAQSNTTMSGYSRIRSSITLNVVGILNDVWREEGLVAIGDKLLAIWSSGDRNGMRLYSATLAHSGSGKPNDDKSQGAKEADVTDRTAILFGGFQRFDNRTGTLDVCMTLRNNSGEPLRAPVKLEATGIRSSVGAISILNASNRVQGEGATWDISTSLTGDRIPPHATSNPFCFSFHVEVSPEMSASPALPNLLTLGLAVLANR